MFYGFDGKKFFKALRRQNNDWFAKDLEEIERQKGTDTTFKFGSIHPILTDRNREGGVMKGHYFHQDLYVAK